MILDDSQIKSVTHLGMTRGCAEGDLLIEAGSEPDSVHVVLSGRVRVVLPGANAEAVDELGRGSVVGEIAVVAGGTRIADVLWATTGESVAVPVGEFAVWLDDQPDLAHAILAEARRRIDENQAVALFVALADDQDAKLATEVARCCEIVHLEAGETLFELGATERCGYLLLSGRMALTDADAQTSLLVRHQFVGTGALVDDVAREFTAVAVRETTVARLRADALVELAHESPRAMLLAARVAINETRSERSSASPTNVAVVVALDDPPEDLVEVLASEMMQHGSVEVVSAVGLGRRLGREGIAQADANSPGLPRLSDYLHTLELERDHVLYVTDAEPSPWTQRVLERADRVLVVVSSTPTATELQIADDATRMSRAAGAPLVLLGIIHPADTDRPSGTAVLVERLGAAKGLNGRRTNDSDLRRWARLLIGRGVGLVLSGGGGKGFAHLGAARALKELSIPIDSVGGASIGGPIGGSIALDLASLSEAEAIIDEQFSKLLDYTIPFTSMLRGKNITESIRDSVGDLDMQDFWIPFYVVSTNLTQSRLELHDRGSCATALRATVAIPGVLPPVPYGGDLLIDGGVLDNLPARQMSGDPTIGTVIAVDVAPPFGPKAKADFGHHVSGFRTLWSRLRGKRETPEIGSVLIRTMLVAAIQDRNALLAEGIVDLHLDLDLKGVSLLDFDRVHEVAQMGYDLAFDRINEWLSSDDAPAAEPAASATQNGGDVCFS